MDLNAEYDNISFVSSHSIFANTMQTATGHAPSAGSPLNTTNTTKHRILKLANELLSICNTDPNNKKHIFSSYQGMNNSRIPIPDKIISTKQLTSKLFVYFFESICDTELVDKKWPSKCTEDEIHNIQSVIDSLSLDILHEDLSHLTGEAICSNDPVSIEYLLDILRCIHEWISSRLQSTDCSLAAHAQIHDDIENQEPKRSDKPKHTATKTNTIRVSDTNDNKSQEINQNQFGQNFFLIEDPNEKYAELSRRFEETVRLTNDALADYEDDSRPMDLQDLIETVNTRQIYERISREQKSLSEEHQDVFKAYMDRKEQEFKLSRQLNEQNGANNNFNYSSKNPLVRAGNGSNSLSSSCTSSTSSFTATNNVRHISDPSPTEADDNQNLYAHSNVKRVKFDVASRNTSSAGPSSSRHGQDPVKSSALSIKRKKVIIPSSIQTQDNEIKCIRENLETNLNIGTEQINHLLRSIYSEDLRDAKSIMQSSLDRVKRKSEITSELYANASDLVGLDGRGSQNNQFTRPKSSLVCSQSSKSKGVLLPTSKSLTNLSKVTLKRSTSLMSLNNSNNTSRSSVLNNRNESGQDVLASNRDLGKEFMSRFTIGEDGILKCLLQEFPYLYTSPETIHYLWQKHAKQIETLTKSQKEFEHIHRNGNVLTTSVLDNGTKCFNKAEQHLKETFRKQELLMDIMRKELEHLKRVEDLKRKQLVENSLKAKAREQRFQNAKVKRYLDEFRLQQRAKLLKQQTSEELVFKKLFNESLKIQKERMLDLKKYTKEKNELNMKQQLNQIESMENFYKNKFTMLNEQMKSEKDSNLIRERAQHVILGKLRKQVKDKLETDIRDLQDQMCRDKDFLYWRQLDADRLKDEIYAANYVNQETK